MWFVSLGGSFGSQGRGRPLAVVRTRDGGEAVVSLEMGDLVVLGGFVGRGVLGLRVGLRVIAVEESVVDGVPGFRVETLGFLVVVEGGVITAVGSTYPGIVGRIGTEAVPVPSATLVGWIGPSVGVWTMGPLVLMVTVGFLGSGMGSRTGGAIVSVGGAMAGDVGVGTILVGGSCAAVVGGPMAVKGVGVALICRRILFGR